MTYLTARLNMLNSALLYLDRHDGLNKIKVKEQLSTKGCFVYIFIIDIDLGLLFEQDAFLGNTVLKMPLESSTVFQEIIYQFCQTNSLLPADTTSTQISARLRLSHFPVCSLQINRISDLTKYVNYQGFVKLVGFIAGISGLAKYTQSTKYICPIPDCDGHEGNHFIRMHISGASETQTIRKDFTCVFCAETLEEVKSKRTLSDKMVIEVVPISPQRFGRENIIRGERMQAVTVFVRDDLVKAVELGKAYEIIGTCRTDPSGEVINLSFEANNIIQLKTTLSPHLTSLSKVMQELYDDLIQSPWRWPINLAYWFAGSIVPGGVMIKLRLVLLMSIVLNPQTHLLHILGVGSETGVFLNLVEYALQFVKRCYPETVTSPLTGKIIGDKHTWAPYFIQGGSLFLAAGGVCSVGDLSGWKKSKRENLQAVLTTNKITLDLAPKHTGGLTQQLTYPLECHVLGTLDPVTLGSKTVKTRDLAVGNCCTGDLTKSFLDAFSFICFLDSIDAGSLDETYSDLTLHKISSWRKEDKQISLAPGDIEQFIAVARNLEPKMLPDAENLLQNYYTASRTARSSGLSGSDVPASSLHTLISLAVGFAKLKLKTFVSECDALMAVYLYEETLTSRYGLSALNMYPQPNVPNSRIDELLGKQNDLLMQHFHVQLLRFCSRAIDIRSIFREE